MNCVANRQIRLMDCIGNVNYGINVFKMFILGGISSVIWFHGDASCHKNRMTTRYITLGYWRVTL